jgi:branched-chain amino acid transport system ATP-binding protein
MLQIDRVKAGYGDAEILNGISFSVKKKSIATILGANGAGKTTLLKVISGILKPNKGEIKYDEERIDGISPDQIVKKGISQVLEGRELFPEMSVFENLMVGGITLNSKKLFKENITRVYEYFPILEKRKEQIAATLSGGEQQMLAIARAMMSSPKMMLLDEPSAGLAPRIIQTICEIIKVINEEGVSILLVEQNVNLGLQISDFSLVMENGNIVISGTRKELLSNINIKKAYLGG